MSVGLRIEAVAVSLLMAVSGCVGGPDPEGVLDGLEDGKADDGSSDQAVELDEADPSWEEVVECSGWDLCLGMLVAARDRYESDESYFYPMHRALDVIFFADHVQISPNCDGRIDIDGEQNIVCTPEDGDAIIFGLFDRADASMDEPWEWINFDYETPARARLFRHVEAGGSYYLDIR